MNGRTDSRPRSLLLLAVLFVAGFALLARLAFWQLVSHDQLAARARAQVSATVDVPSIRGTIFDRTGVTVLATTIQRDRLVAYPAMLVTKGDPTKTAETQAKVAGRLVEILGLQGDKANALRAAIESGKPYATLASGLTPTQSAAVRTGMGNGQLPQVRLEADYTRLYPGAGGAPKSSLASHLLGFVNSADEGQYGVEGKWQETLAGSPRTSLATRDGSGRLAVESATLVSDGVPGADLTLTIDASLQLKVEQEVYAAAVANQARNVSAIVMNPKTGAILASATYPAYDANSYRTVAAKNPGVFLDPTISAFYEPGSVFKMLTAAAALRAGVVKRTTRVQDQAVLVLDNGKTKIRNADRTAKPKLTFQDAVAWSRNVVMSKVALKFGKSTRQSAQVLHQAWTDFGFGRTTGVDLAGEVSGIVRDPSVSPWSESDVANGSFGQGVAVTLMQLAAAYSAMVNGGTLPTPHVVAAVNGEAVTQPDPVQVIKPALSRELIAVMKRVVNVVPFYTARTRINGYVVGGKTGTAQIWDGKKQAWRSDVYNFSFAGFVGRTSPDLVVVVRITEGKPLVNRSGNIVNAVESFELFRRIAFDGMTTLDLLPPGRTVTRATGTGTKSTAEPAASPRAKAKATARP